MPPSHHSWKAGADGLGVTEDANEEVDGVDRDDCQPSPSGDSHRGDPDDNGPQARRDCKGAGDPAGIEYDSKRPAATV